MKKCVYQHKAMKGYYGLCGRDGSLRKFKCELFCSFFKPTWIFKIRCKIRRWLNGL